MTEERGAIKMIKRKIMITLAATVAAMTLVTGCGKKTTSITEISGVVQVAKDSDEKETSGDKKLPTITKETEKSESASEEKGAETSSGTDETDIKPAEKSEKAYAKQYRARHLNLQLMNNRQSRYRNQVRQLHSLQPKHLLKQPQRRLQHLLLNQQKRRQQNRRNLK